VPALYLGRISGLTKAQSRNLLLNQANRFKTEEEPPKKDEHFFRSSLYPNEDDPYAIVNRKKIFGKQDSGMPEELLKRHIIGRPEEYLKTL
jgi:hypothetical protein